ncbi:YdgA family protein [Legionella cardiaca]|uniref:YdgA family protein n=1 Tax=Legionella cardiaca TaxID=1071983 RepID=A0ABY8ASM1_9GAMM|nr:YdgA family protein [Legionella cardiaca]WED43538.1 YdgA family protein [Legionella cardiaca]
MKKWIGFFAALVVLVLVAYYVMGYIAKSTLNKNVNAIPKTSLMSIDLEQYQLGWFSSKARLKLKMHIPAQKTTDKEGVTKIEPPANLKVDVPLTIKHGPVIFTKNGIRFGIAQVTTKPETHYGVLINYFNKTVLRYTLPSISMQGKSEAKEGDFQFNWKGLKALLCISSNIDNVDGHLKLYGVEGSADNVILKIGKVRNDLQLKRYHDWLWLGQSHLDISSASMDAEGANIFALERFDFTADSGVTEDVFHLNSALSLKKLVANNQSYGPGILKLSITNLEPAALAKINQQALDMMQNNNDPNLVMLALLAELPRLLTKGPVLEVSEMTLHVPQGKIEGNLKIVLPKNETNDLNQTMQKMHGEGRFKAPIAVIRELMVASINSDLANKTQTTADGTTTPQPAAIPMPASTPSTSMPVATPEDAQQQTDKILQNLVSKGFLKIEGRDYVLNFKIENQQLIVNGQPFNSAMLQ